jgi:hypothetical protein
MLLFMRATGGAQHSDEEALNTGKIRDWRSIVTLIVFVLTSKSDDA